MTALSTAVFTVASFYNLFLAATKTMPKSCCNRSKQKLLFLMGVCLHMYRVNNQSK